MSKKLKLEDLKLESFITELDNSVSTDIKGGAPDTYGACDNTGKSLDCSGWLCDSTDVSQQSECESCGAECGSVVHPGHPGHPGHQGDYNNN